MGDSSAVGSSAASALTIDIPTVTPAPVSSTQEYQVGQRVQCLRQDGHYYDADVIEKRRAADGSLQYYIHYSDLNKRLDRWADASEVRDFDPSLAQHPASSPSHQAAAALADSKRRVTRREKRKFDLLAAEHGVPSEHDVPHDGLEAVLEKHHEERTKVKNIDVIQIGEFEVDCWYFSPYPDEYRNVKKLYICEWCLKYMKKPQTLEKHKTKCFLRHPPGSEIYRDKNISVFEVNGSRQKVYCQNLCLLAKLFIDHKTLYYDVDPFLFYILTEASADGCRVVGYFSKEKESAENNNVACILTFPQYQRKGYGNFLIAFSYELSKIEQKPGSPEKPLSDLGKTSYRSYWIRVLLEALATNPHLTIQELGRLTCVKKEDIISTLQHLDLVRYVKGEHVIAVTPKVLELHQMQLKKPWPLVVHPNKLRWVPPPVEPKPKQRRVGSATSVSASS